MALFKTKEQKLKEKAFNWEKEKALLDIEYRIKQEKKKYANKTSTTKVLIAFLFINFTIIELFVGWITVKSLLLSAQTLVAPDFTPLVTLIGAIVGEVVSYAVYSIKSAKENCDGGLIYMQAKAQLEQDIKG